MQKILAALLLACILHSCKGPPRSVPFPSEQDEFPQPQVSIIKIREAKKTQWLPSTREMKAPVVMNVRYIKSKDSVFSLKMFHPLPQNLDSNIVRPQQMHSVPLSLKDLPQRKIKPSIVLMGQPEKIRAALPVVETEFTKGLLELGQDQGLPGTEVHSIQQDKLHRLWFSTDNGLCFFDGEYIYKLGKKLGLSRNSKNNICLDKKGHIWAAGNGVDEIIPEQGIIRHYGKKEGLYSDRVVAVDMDSTGTLYFSEADGIDVYNPYDQHCVHIGKSEGLSIGININRVTADRKGRIWIASNCGGVNIYDPASEKLFLLFDSLGLGNNDCRSIITDKQNKIWMGLWNGGVDCYDFETGVLLHLREKNGLSMRYIYHLMQDHEGKIWVSCLDTGLDIYDPVERKMAHLFGKRGIVKSTVPCSFEDSEGRIWFGTNGAGVLRYDPFNGDINNYNNKWLATQRPVLSLMQDTHGKIWISTVGAGVSIYDPAANTMSEFYEGTDWPNAFQMDMKDDGKGRYYLCNDFNFVIYDTTKPYLTFRNGEHGLPEGNLRGMAFLNGDVLIGSNGGLLKYSPKEDKFYILRSKQDSADFAASCILPSKNGKFWIGTYNNGLFLFDPSSSSLSHFSKAQGLTNNSILCLAEDKNGNIWIGTSGNGIKILNLKNQTITSLDRDNGLAESTVTSLLEKDDKIYAGTAKGLSVISVSGTKFKLKNFGKPQGFRTSDFNTKAALLNKDGSIWWGIGDMLTIYKPPVKEEKIVAPSITSIDLMEKEMHFDADTSDLSLISYNDTVRSPERDTFYFRTGLQKLKNEHIKSAGIKWKSTSGEYGLPSELTLPYNCDHLTFHYTGNYTANTDKVRYRYILEGADEQWSPVVNVSTVDYRNIAPGNYVFKVCSKNFNSDWSEPASFSFSVTPPWWKTGLAYSAYGLLMVSVVFGYNRVRTGQLLKRQKELEEVVSERTKEVVAQKNEIALQKQTVEEKQKEIVDSINYAKRIQYTLLTHEKVLQKHFSEHFILFQPKDIVSGDFYWSTKANAPNGHELFYLAVCDSTGHGVPGAFMSLLNISFLNEAVNEKNIHQPDAILNYVRDRLVNSISRDGAKDGMDGLLMCFEADQQGTILKITYAAGNNPPMVFSKGALNELPYNKMPIGKGEQEKEFELHSIALQKGDIIYFYTDGFADQFGGPKGKKFKYKQLNELLLTNATQPLEKQKQILLTELNKWKGNFEQVDDICIIGVRL